MTPEQETVAQPAPAASLVAALVELRAAISEIPLALELPGTPLARVERGQLLDQLDDYLLPRARAAGAPLLVVVGGSTGAGKSTLINSLLGEVVSTAGVLRPTTRAPVLVHHPVDAPWFRGDRVLPGLARITAAPGAAARGGDGPAAPPGPEPTAPPEPPSAPASSRGRALRLVASEAVPPGLALLDAPDIDSVVAENRRLATQLLGAADLWLFVTTAARYADAVPWDLLETAARRRAEVALVLDRVDPGTEGPVGIHLAQMLAEHGLGSAPILVVAEAPLVDGLLPDVVVTPVADWLTALGGDAAARSAAIARTRDGMTADLLARAAHLAAAADAQRAADRRLRAMVASPYADALSTVLRATSDGTMLRGEVLARWQDVVGTGEFLRAMQTRIGWVRDRVVAAVQGRRAAEPELTSAIGHGLEAVVLDAAEDAAQRAHAGWHADPAGAGLLTGLELARGSADLRAQVATQIRAWQSDVLDLVAAEGADKRAKARALSLGVNGFGAVLMVAVFASTGGLTGAEVGIAGGSALLAQRVLEAAFGDDAVRQLARTASDRLAARVQEVLVGQAARYTRLLDAAGTAAASGQALRAAAQRAAAEVDRARAQSLTAEPVRATTVAGPAATGAGLPRGAGTLRGAGLVPVSQPRVGAAAATPGADAPTDRAAWAGGLRGWWRRRRRGPAAP